MQVVSFGPRYLAGSLTWRSPMCRTRMRLRRTSPTRVLCGMPFATTTPGFPRTPQLPSWEFELIW